jgi:hypothetical protein
LSTCPPTDAPICASSPTAWIAVVTSCGPEGGPDERGGGGGSGVTGRGCAFIARGFTGSDFAVLGLAAAAFLALGFAAVRFVAAVFVVLDFAVLDFAAPALDAFAAALGGSRRPNRSGRVAGRLPSTLGCALAVFFDFFGFALLLGTTTVVEGARDPQYSHRKQRARRSLNPENIAPRLTPRSCSHVSSGQGAMANGRPSQMQRCLQERRRERDIDVSS